MSYGNESGRRSPMLGRLMIAGVIVLVSLVSYYGKRSFNPVTNEVQHVDITSKQEIALGMQAAPEMEQQFGGDETSQRSQRVEKVGRRLVDKTAAGKTDYPFQFHLLSDRQTLNAFALPGGQVFITRGLFDKLETDGQLAGVLGHEVGHVVARHGAEHIAKSQLVQGLSGAAVIATYDPDNPRTMQNAQVAALIAGLVNMRFGRQDELEADRLGVRFIHESGYDPRAMIGVMQILENASKGSRQPEFFSTHPNPENRITKIEEAIKKEFPDGVPTGLEK